MVREPGTDVNDRKELTKSLNCVPLHSGPDRLPGKNQLTFLSALEHPAPFVFHFL